MYGEGVVMPLLGVVVVAGWLVVVVGVWFAVVVVVVVPGLLVMGPGSSASTQYDCSVL